MGRRPPGSGGAGSGASRRPSKPAASAPTTAAKGGAKAGSQTGAQTPTGPSAPPAEHRDDSSPIRRSVIETPVLGSPRGGPARPHHGAPVEVEPEAPAEVEPEAPAEAEPEAPAEAEAEVETPAEAEPEVEAEPEAPAEPESEPPAPPASKAGRPHAGPTTRAPASHPISSRAPAMIASEVALSVSALSKSFGDTVAVDAVDLTVPAGSFFGFVGPNGAGKTTTLSMVTGLLRPDSGIVKIYGVDVWANPAVAKKSLGVLPDRLRLFDRLTGSEFLHHAGALRGLDRQTISSRVDDLERAFGIEHSASRLVSDYSAGMVKKIGIAAAMIHSPRLLVLDEPFESVDPVSAQVVIDILKKFAAAGGTVLLSSHSMDLIERICDSVAIIAEGRMLASGPIADVLDGHSLEQRFVELAGGATAVEGMEWLQSFSD